MKILLTILLLSMGVFAQNAFDKVSWLTGCWGGDMKGGSVYEECWTRPFANFMQGSGRMIKGDKILMREHITIEKEGDDLVMYVLNYGAKMKAEQDPTPFKLTKSSATELVFENPKHDYPQRIIYKKDTNGDITAFIEMLDGTKPMKFPMNNLMKKK
jgi:hypothetical protein